MGNPGLGRKLAAGFAGVFGAATLFVGGSALSGAADFGAIVPFVLRFNFISGFVYLALAWGLWSNQGFARPLAATMFWASLIVALGLLWHVLQGGDYMPRTLWAIVARTLVWGGLALLARRVIPKG